MVRFVVVACDEDGRRDGSLFFPSPPPLPLLRRRRSSLAPTRARSRLVETRDQERRKIQA